MDLKHITGAQTSTRRQNVTLNWSSSLHVAGAQTSTQCQQPQMELLLTWRRQPSEPPTRHRRTHSNASSTTSTPPHLANPVDLKHIASVQLSQRHAQRQVHVLGALNLVAPPLSRKAKVEEALKGVPAPPAPLLLPLLQPFLSIVVICTVGAGREGEEGYVSVRGQPLR